MAVWEVRVVMQAADRKWENVWHVDVGSATDVPSGVIVAIQNFTINWLLPSFELLEIARRVVGTHDEFIIDEINHVGERTGFTGDALPLFNTVRALLGGGIGRSGAKFLRGVLTTGDLADNNGTIASALVSGLGGDLTSLISAVVAASCELVFGDGKTVTTSNIQNFVQSRQRHRKRRRTP